jgi:FkbM family methyltransferase
MSIRTRLLRWARAGTVPGRLLRLPLRLVPKRAILPILSGPARGCRWTAGSTTHGAWLGTYEAEKQGAIVRHLAAGAVFYDIGANVGVYTLLASKLVGDNGQVVAFEPLPENLAFLRRHIELNRCANVRVVEAALSDRSGSGMLATEGHRSMGRLTTGGSVAVAVLALDAAVARLGLPLPGVLKMDIEGGEAAALRGAGRTVDSSRPTIFLSTHGRTVREECLAWLRGRAYVVAPLPGDETGEEWIARPPKEAELGAGCRGGRG